ncbi:MAG: DUF3999 domain-containing protein [Rhodothermales bacterium]
MKRFRSIVPGAAAVLCLLAGLPPRAHGQDITPARFAYGIVIDTVGTSPVQRFVLPDTVYTIATRADLGDIRLFNSDGEPLAYAIENMGAEAEPPPDRVALPFFPLYRITGEDAGDVQVEVRRTASGTLVRVDGRPATPDPAVTAFVVDASALDKPVNAITLAWEDTADDFLVEAYVETSEDLNRWQPWGDAATVAQLRRMGSVLLRDELKLPARDARYYRIRFRGAPPPISRIAATLTADDPPPVRRWLHLTTLQTDRGVFDAEQNGVYPVDRVRVTFDKPNTLARIRIESAASPDGPWRRHYSGTAYRIEENGQTLESPEIPIRLTHNRYWRVVAGQGAEGDPSLHPIVVLGWSPSRVLFLTRGAPPYTLAFGNGEIGPAAFAASDISRLTSTAQLEDARPGAIRALGGESRLRKPMDVDWKTVLLWAALAFGVAVLGALALSLTRQVQRDRDAGA